MYSRYINWKIYAYLQPYVNLSSFILCIYYYLQPVSVNTRAPETTWVPGARCDRSGTNGQVVVRSLQNFHDRQKLFLRCVFMVRDFIRRLVTTFSIHQQNSCFTRFSNKFIKLEPLKKIIKSLNNFWYINICFRVVKRKTIETKAKIYRYVNTIKIA